MLEEESLPANQEDIDVIVRRALSECAEAFTRGVHSFHAGQKSDLQIRAGVIESVENSLRPSFYQRLEKDGEKRWKQDGDRVRRVAFYAGALAALHAYGGGSAWLEKAQAHEAMEHVSKQCKAPENPRIRWFYCPWP